MRVNFGFDDFNILIIFKLFTIYTTCIIILLGICYLILNSYLRTIYLIMQRGNF
jgi:hypothetical protein